MLTVYSDPSNPLVPRIVQYVDRMVRSRTEIFDEASRKRGPPEVTNGLDPAKRQKLGAQVPAPPVKKFHVPSLTPGPHTIAQLFTITTDEALKTFDVAQLSEDLVVKIGITILQRIDADTLNQAVDVSSIRLFSITNTNNIQGIRERLKLFSATPPEQLNPSTSPLGVEEDDDDYEPDFYNAEDTEQILNKLDNAPPEVEEVKLDTPDMALGHFTLPTPPALTADETIQVGQGTVSRVFGVMQTLDEPGKKTKSGLNRLAASEYDRDAWITIISRLASRASAGLEEPSDVIKADPAAPAIFSLSNSIREALYLYVLEDFRKRIDIAVAWLCEEWYNDKIQKKVSETAKAHYEDWVMKVLDGILPYLDARDKVLTRFLSEIPGLSTEVLDRVKGLCRDPSMVNLALTSLLYLVMMRPPVREIALDAVEDIWQTCKWSSP